MQGRRPLIMWFQPHSLWIKRFCKMLIAKCLLPVMVIIWNIGSMKLFLESSGFRFNFPFYISLCKFRMTEVSSFSTGCVIRCCYKVLLQISAKLKPYQTVLFNFVCVSCNKLYIGIYTFLQYVPALCIILVQGRTSFVHLFFFSISN